MRKLAKGTPYRSAFKGHYVWRGRACGSILLLCFLCAGLAPAADAQLRECRGTLTEVGLKILRDAVSYDSSGASQSAMARVADRLNAKLSNDVDEFHLIGGTPVVIVRCPDRHHGRSTNKMELIHIVGKFRIQPVRHPRHGGLGCPGGIVRNSVPQNLKTHLRQGPAALAELRVSGWSEASTEKA